MQLPTKARKWIHEFQHYWADKPPVLTTYRCCISLANNDLSLVYINKKTDDIELLLSETLRLDNIDSLPLVLSGIASKHSLDGVPIYWMLSPNDYQLIVMDGLPVPKEEFYDALSWRMRNLIPYPINEAIIDSFSMPAKKSSENTMVGAIAARAKPLTQMANVLEKINLKLTVIDIPELAMRNLTAIFENDEKSTAFLYFCEKMIILNITCKKLLFFTRRIELTHEGSLRTEDYEKLSLEILRYFDYFQSQWRYPTPSRIFVSSQKLDITEIAQSLSTYLMLTVEPFSVASIVSNKSQLDLIDKKCLLQFGCAIREDNPQ